MHLVSWLYVHRLLSITMLTEMMGESKYLSMQQLPLAHTWLFIV